MRLCGEVIEMLVAAAVGGRRDMRWRSHSMVSSRTIGRRALGHDIRRMTPAGGHDRKLRVVTLVDRLGTGGAERLAIQTTTRLDPERFDRTLVASRDFDVAISKQHVANALADLRAADVRVIGLKRTSARQVWAWWPLYRLLRRERVDVLHAHKFGSNLWGTIVGRLARVPVIVAHEHTWSYEGQPLRRLADRAVIARGSSAFVAVSREDQRRMIEVEQHPPRGHAVHPQRDSGAAAAERRRRARGARHRGGRAGDRDRQRAAAAEGAGRAAAGDADPGGGVSRRCGS